MNIDEALDIVLQNKIVNNDNNDKVVSNNNVDMDVTKEIFAELRSFRRSFIWLAVTIPLIGIVLSLVPIIFFIMAFICSSISSKVVELGL